MHGLQEEVCMGWRMHYISSLIWRQPVSGSTFPLSRYAAVRNAPFQHIESHASGSTSLGEKSEAEKRFLLVKCVAAGWQISNSQEQIHRFVVSHSLHISSLLPTRSWALLVSLSHTPHPVVLLQLGSIFHSTERIAFPSDVNTVEVS